MRYLKLIILAVLVVIALGSIRPLTEWMWFANLGYGLVFLKILFARLELVAIFAGGFLVIVGLNLRLASRVAPMPLPVLEREEDLRERLGAAARMGIAAMFLMGLLVVTFFVATDAWTRWNMLLQFRNAVPFGNADPLFHKDIGFYVFTLPFLKYIYGWLMFTLFASLAGVIGFHYMNRAIEFFANVPRFAPGVKSHLSILLALMLAAKAWGYRLQAYELLFTPGRLFTGAGYTDVHAKLPALTILSVAAVVAALVVLIGARKSGIRFAVAAVVGLTAISIAVGGIFPPIIQQLTVKANEPTKEKKYITWAIRATNDAYGLSATERRTFPAESELTQADVAKNQAILQNVRIWNYTPVQHVYTQLQEIQQYYSFTDVDIDRYMINGKPRQVMLSGREMSQESLPITAQTWVNKHLQYTHGYGLCMSPVNVVTEEGLPQFFIRDIPPITTPDLEVRVPQIYFGDLTNTYILVKTTEREFDYPSGDENKFSTYKADAGVPMGNYFTRLLWSARLGDPYILLNKNVTPQTRLLYRRNIRERMARVLPFLSLDNDPYLVLAGGKMYWMQDAYTTTDRYPYSAKSDVGLNYIRNSVKITVDAYTGEVNAYVFDPLDPIIQTYRKAFPGMLKPMSAMPDQLLAHIRYPEDLFRVQVQTLLLYHMRDPFVFYNKGDVWAVPAVEPQPDQPPVDMEPYYIITKLPGAKKEEFILMFPFRRESKQNMVAWMCARCDPDDYGKLLLYEFPKGELIYGPSQIAGRANQNGEISREVTLWSSAGSNITWGNLLVIPIEKSLLYIRPLYLESTATKIPEFRRVVVALGEELAWAPTFEDALSQVITGGGAAGGAAPLPTGVPEQAAATPRAPTRNIGELVSEARSHYDAAQKALREGDWAAYGREQQALSESLVKLKTATE